MKWCRVFDGYLSRLLSVQAWLILPIVGFLAAQWPLRDWVHGFSREANDMGQCIFALYVAGSVVAASRAGAHVSASGLFAMTARWRKRLSVCVALFGLLPWSLFVIIHGAPMVWQSLQTWERFPDTLNAGYFLIKMAAVLLAFLLLIQVLVARTDRT